MQGLGIWGLGGLGFLAWWFQDLGFRGLVLGLQDVGVCVQRSSLYCLMLGDPLCTAAGLVGL